MSVLENLGPNPAMLLLQLAFFILPPIVAWLYLYLRGATARDLIFWGAIILFIPVLGPIIALLGFTAMRRHKSKRG